MKKHRVNVVDQISIFSVLFFLGILSIIYPIYSPQYTYVLCLLCLYVSGLGIVLLAKKIKSVINQYVFFWLSLCVFSCSPSASVSLFLCCLRAGVARCCSLCVIFSCSPFCLCASLFCCLSAVLLGSIAVCVFSCSLFCLCASASASLLFCCVLPLFDTVLCEFFRGLV